MSYKSTKAVIRASCKRINRSEKMVLAALADCQNSNTQLCFPSKQTIAERSGYCVRQVTRILNRLRSKGVVTWQTVNSGTRVSHNYYQLHLHELASSSGISNDVESSQMRYPTEGHFVPDRGTFRAPTEGHFEQVPRDISSADRGTSDVRQIEKGKREGEKRRGKHQQQQRMLHGDDVDDCASATDGLKNVSQAVQFIFNSWNQFAGKHVPYLVPNRKLGARTRRLVTAWVEANIEDWRTYWGAFMEIAEQNTWLQGREGFKPSLYWLLDFEGRTNFNPEGVVKAVDGWYSEWNTNKPQPVAV